MSNLINNYVIPCDHLLVILGQNGQTFMKLNLIQVVEILIMGLCKGAFEGRSDVVMSCSKDVGDHMHQQGLGGDRW
jgi:hypothetical protein